MNNDTTKGTISNLLVATKEARELHRIRNSFTFRFGIEIIRAIKFPPLLLILPYTIIRLLFGGKKSEYSLEANESDGVVIIGVDRIEEFYSSNARILAEIISEDGGFGRVTLVNNENQPPSDKMINWFRIPAARSLHSERKVWNIIAERVISSAINITPPTNIIFFGDYLYRGIVDALFSSPEETRHLWFLVKESDGKDISLDNYPDVKRIHVTPFLNTAPQTQSIHKLLRIPDKEKIMLVDIDRNNFSYLPPLDEIDNVDHVVGIQRDKKLPPEIKLAIRLSDVDRMMLEGEFFSVIDESSPLISSLCLGGNLTILLRNGRNLSEMEEMMVSDMELSGALVVLRRLDQLELIHALNHIDKYQMQIKERKLQYVNPNRVTGKSNYIVEWLKKSFIPHK
jgi:hypothetical protein